jgi:hypothetical protein
VEAAEAVFGNGNVVDAGLQVGRGEFAFLVGLGGAGFVGAGVADFHLGPRHGGAGRVDDDAY